MDWILLQILGVASCAVAHAAGKYYGGLNLISFSIYSILSIAIAGWAFPKSYEFAPTFFQAFFVGTGALAIFIFIISFMMFHEAVSIWNIIGAIGVVGCSILLII